MAGELQPALRNFTLSQSQQERFRRDGFVVVPSNGGSGSNFVDSLHDVFANDLPVFLSADAVLHAIHVTFDDAVTTLERQRMIPLLQEVLDSMSGELEALAHVGSCGRRTQPTRHPPPRHHPAAPCCCDTGTCSVTHHRTQHSPRCAGG